MLIVCLFVCSFLILFVSIVCLFLFVSEKRTEKGPDVSGHIKVNISMNVEGESFTPFHQQYIKLHEVCIKCSVCSNDDRIRG